MKQRRQPLPLVLLTSLCLLGSRAVAQEDRPTAMELMPSETVLLLRTADASLLGERFAASGTGRLMNDPEMEAFVSAAGEEITSAYNDRLREALGVDLNELRRLPAGELAFAVVERPRRSPALAAIADFGDRSDQAEQVFGRLQDLAEENGRSVAQETLRNDTATLFRNGNDQNRVLAVVRRASTFLLATDRDLLQSLLDRWDGIAIGVAEENESGATDRTDDGGDSRNARRRPLFADPLADKPSFGATMRQCLPGREEPPQAIFYADPVGMIRAIAGQQTPVRLALATFPALGIDGVQGVGGALWIATDKWESLIRGHLLLDNPRAGVMKIARFEPGDLSPPSLTPTGLENLFSFHADPQRLLNEIERLVDRFRYEGSLQKDIDNNLSEPLGVDFREEVLSNLEGHACLMTGYDEGQARVNRRGAIALRQKDGEETRRVLAKIAKHLPDVFTSTSRGSDEYYLLGPLGMTAEGRATKTVANETGADAPRTQRQVGAVGLIGDTLLLATSEALYNRCLDAFHGVGERYVDSLQHRLIAGRLNRLAGGAQPSMAHFHDPEPAIRLWHGVAARDGSKEWLRSMSERVTLFRVISNTLDRVELPPVETLLKYNSPGGTVIYDTPTGFQFVSFAFKR